MTPIYTRLCMLHMHTETLHINTQNIHILVHVQNTCIYLHVYIIYIHDTHSWKHVIGSVTPQAHVFE